MINYNSALFYLYAILGALIFRQANTASIKKTVLFFINLVFFMLLFYARKKHLLLLILLLVFNYLTLKLAMKFGRYRKIIGIAVIAISLLFLSFFKYDLVKVPILGMFPHLKYFLRPAVFIGISFFSFRLIHIIVDIINESIVKLDFFHFFNFLMFFPCYLSGPLDRYQRFIGDFESQEPDGDVSEGQSKSGSPEAFNAVYRIIKGAFKKTVIANILETFSIFSIPNYELMHFSRLQILLAVNIYSLVLFFDFSGYSDIAIGISNLFRISTPENFNRPYLSRNIQDFWNRWHMSFTSWLKDYLYFPFGRLLYWLKFTNPILVSCLSFILTFLLAGIWHGDGINFVWYGLYHGSGLAILVFYRSLLRKWLSKSQIQQYEKSWLARGAGMFITLVFVTVGWFFFLGKEVGLKILYGV